MADPAFDRWLAAKTWAQGVRYSRAVAWLLPPAALAVDLPHLLAGPAAWPPAFGLLLAWQLSAELFFLGIVAVDRWLPSWRGREGSVHLACIGALALATWIGVADLWRIGDLSIYAAGATFVAAVMCTPRPVRRPLYVLSLLVIAVPAWQASKDLGHFVAALVNPFCVVVLCIELDRFSYSRNRELYLETQRAEAERARADQVLYNVLPAPIADELKREGRVQAAKFENMAVLFADIAGFTQFSRALPPDALVLVLNEIFSVFDTLVERRGVEKIKTIGDAYMVASPDRLDALCALGLDLCCAMARYNQANGTRLEMRVGIHVGPAVAGVIGVRRFLYDVWGDTVNLASRMEGTGEPGAVHVSEAVRQQVQGHFVLEAREPLEIRGRGRVQTYWLRAPATPTPLPAGAAADTRVSACETR